jgi:hypothetical protein
MDKEKLKRNLRSGGFGIISAVLAGLVTLLIISFIVFFLLSNLSHGISGDYIAPSEFLDGMKGIFWGHRIISPFILVGWIVLGYLGGVISPKLSQKNWWKTPWGPIFIGAGVGILWIGILFISGIWIIPLIGN